MPAGRRTARLRGMPTSTAGSIAGWPADRWPGADRARAADQRLVGAPRQGAGAGPVRALRQGDELAFARLVRRHQGSMLNVARLYVADRSVAEEVVQDTWLAVGREIDGFEGRCALTTWLYRILVNRARSRGARERRIVPGSSLAGGCES